jgi:hypothetical protein
MAIFRDVIWWLNKKGTTFENLALTFRKKALTFWKKSTPFFIRVNPLPSVGTAP